MGKITIRQIVRTFTPETRRQSFVAFALIMLSIVGLNHAFHVLMFGELVWPVGWIIMNAVAVGAPFTAVGCIIGMLQVRTLRDLSLRSRKDDLTSLNNRRTFMRLAHQRMQSQPKGILLLLDADHFKNVNDTYGHAVGDNCLIAISRHLQWNLRSDDVAGRIGGEEFAIYLANVTIEQARVIGARLAQPIPFHGPDEREHLCITLSVGGALTDGTHSLDRLLIQADNALYAAKAAGRARMVIYDAALHQRDGQAA